MEKITLNNTGIIISYRESSVERKDNLYATLRYLDNTFYDYNVYLIEADSKPKFQWDILSDNKINHKFVHNPGLFPKAFLYNTGVKLCSSEIVVLHDSDMIVNPHSFISAVDMVKNSPMTVMMPFYEVINVEGTEKELFCNHPHFNQFASVEKSNLPPLFHHMCTGAVGGVNVINREQFINAGGLNTEIIGWGSEDGEFCARTRHLGLNWVSLDYPAFHLHHDSINREHLIVNEQRLNNFKIEQFAMDATEEQIKKLVHTLRNFFV